MKSAKSIDLKERLQFLLLSVFVSSLLLISFSTFVSAEIDAQNFEISKSVTANDRVPGGKLQYTLVVSNTGSLSGTFTLRDQLPQYTQFVPDSFEKACNFYLYEKDGLIRSDPYLLQPGQAISATFEVEVDESIPAVILAGGAFASYITNTVELLDIGTNQTVTSTAVAMVMTNTSQIYLPFMADLAAQSVSMGRSIQAPFMYQENFSEPCNPTDWRIVRQDTDTVDNQLFIRDTTPGYLDLRMRSRFDYMIASDLSLLPPVPYTLTARMRIEDASPRHTGGIVLAGDYDGASACPMVDYSTCFNQYYRFRFIAGNTPQQMRVDMRKIEDHSTDSNSSIGTQLGVNDLVLNNATRSSWIEWTIVVAADGEMVLFRDGSEVIRVMDTEYQDNRYFGFWSETSDTSFSNTQVDWVRIESQ